MDLSQARNGLDGTLHSPVRLSILGALNSVDSVDYQTLKDALGVSYSLLTKHLGVLEQASLVKVDKQFVSRTPVTNLKLTKQGRQQFENYLLCLDRIVQGLTAESMD
ncbi:TPA: helix-turn-helix domain-containing protein [Corynebacterium striatum]|uniref:Transcriptional regulator n=1 Tax=Corynebacterium striatum TaxID=43770 RepID=A0A2Z2J3V9_CORST|nr:MULTISPECIES: transcriptional regulator [Corynebacterium]ART21444.1 transcriptional regulator [Corynebacterium striatum]MCG7248762.1 transcriptional regulator [Corynebacterium striatum]QQU79858.1 transcriptional regulator [Corynebacterium striatum]TXS63593.1 transcriptional regulator [Corynebacterium sp. LK14]HAT1143755.1 helix-turn-helix domain-containing protein [Corynebacterium striatum]